MQTINQAQINTGDTLLVSGYSFLAKEIQQFEKCSWNHAGMFVRLITDTIIKDKQFSPGLYVAEMVREGFVLTPFQEYINDYKCQLLVLKPKFAINQDDIWSFIQPDLYREGYGFFNLLIAQPIKYLTNYRIWLGDVSDNNPRRFICGEKVEYIYNHFNQDIFPDWKSSAPSDIYNSDLFDKFVYSRIGM